MRKSAGFDIADYITVSYAAAGRLAAALARNRAYLAAEVLARELRAVAALDEVTGGYRESFGVDGAETTVGIARV